MTRTVRMALFGAAGLVLVLAIGAGVALMVLDPNDFKPKIEAAALAATGKKLSLKGDLSFSVFPRLSLEAGPAELEDDPGFGSEPFARLEQLSASVELLPLFSGRAEIGSVTVSGLRLKLAVNESGTANWNMRRQAGSGRQEPAAPPPGESGGLAKPASSQALSSVALDSLTVEDALIVYADMRSQSGMQLALPSLQLKNLKVGQKSALSLQAAYTGPMARPITLSLDAGFTLPPSLAEGVQFSAKGALDETPITWEGSLALPDTAEGQRLSFRGSLSAGDLNLDRYIAALGAPGGKTSSGAKPSSGKAPEPGRDGASGTRPEDEDATLREMLRALYLDVHIDVRSLTVANVPVSSIQTSVKADKGLLVAKPVTMTVAQAPLSTELSLDARGDSLKTRATGEWKGARLGPLLKAATGKTPFSGTLDAAWSVSATGANAEKAARSLGGTVTAKVTNGRLPAFRLIPPGVSGLPAKTMDLVDIAASGTWKLDRGVARNDDFTARAAGLSAAGNGRVNIPARTLHYAVSVELPTLPELPNLTVLPVVISGPFASPSYGIDQPALLRDTAKSILNPATKAGGEIQRAGERLGRLLSR